MSPFPIYCSVLFCSGTFWKSKHLSKLMVFADYIFVVLGSPRLILRNQCREPHEEAAHSALDTYAGGEDPRDLDSRSRKRGALPGSLQTPCSRMHLNRSQPQLSKSRRHGAEASLVHLRK